MLVNLSGMLFAPVFQWSWWQILRMLPVLPLLTIAICLGREDEFDG